ncbi:MAG TPA: imidazolonepropionase [bacterium]|nr:imidazolonepropionase [bacterium]HPN35005.1 imidazolonepropionase [bacterium]
MGHLFIRNARQVVTALQQPARGPDMSRVKVYERTSLYVRDGIIRAMGALADVEKEISGQPQVVDAEKQVVLPGLVDSHTHLVFAGTREEEFCLRNAGLSYQEAAGRAGGILSTVAATRRASREELVEIGSRYLALALRHGTTSMEIKSGYGLDEEQEIKLLQVIHDLDRMQPIQLVPTYLGAHAIPPGKTAAQYTDEVIALLPRIAGLARFCDVFCEQGYFTLEQTERIFHQALHCGLKLRLHADQLSANGGVSLAASMGAASVDHLEQISRTEIALLGSSNTCATLLPGVSLFLRYGYPPGRSLIDHGAIVALASNFNPGSCMCLNLQLMMSLACTQMAFSPEEAINAVTVNAAYSLGLERTGLIAAGAMADLVLMDLADYRLAPYFFGINHARMVIKRGRIVWANV